MNKGYLFKEIKGMTENLVEPLVQRTLFDTTHILFGLCFLCI